MKGTVGSPHGWLYLTFRWFETSKKLFESCRLINNIVTGYNKNTKQMRCWAMKSCSHVKGSLCLHEGWDRLLWGLVWDPWKEESEGHRPQWWLTFDTQSPALWSEPLPSTCHKPGVWYYQGEHIINHKWLFRVLQLLELLMMKIWNIYNNIFSNCWWNSADRVCGRQIRFYKKGLTMWWVVWRKRT